MQATSVKFLNDILENGRYFYIPVYQRNYSWQDEHCKQLIKDIMKIYNGVYNDHFIGTIVWKADDGNSDNLSVIDGQQRLTTMFLLVLAMRDNCDNLDVKEVLDQIIFAKLTKQIRLMPIKNDNEVFMEIVNGRANEVTRKSNRIYANYYYFCEYIKEYKVDIRKLYTSIGKLDAIKMELHQTDNPQIIFESINSTGMSLSIADLIRNFLLMNESYETQTRLFENYWYQFENKLGVEKLVAFFEHFLNLKVSDKSVNRSNMYTYFKSYFVDNNYTAETLLEYLKPYVDAYSYLCNPDEVILVNVSKINRLNQFRDEIVELENTTSYMFLMPTILAFNENKIDEEQLLYSFEITLSYLFRRNLIGLGTNVLQGTFRRLFNQTQDNMGKYGWKNALNYALVTSKMNSNAYFPNDELFYNSLYSRNLYGKFKYIKYLLLGLENEGNKTKFHREEFTIEHVMPQTASKYWREILGDNWKSVHEENVNDLGNLTLTSYNSELSNSDFSTKKALLDQEGHIKLNRYFRELDKWTEKEIIDRGKVLAQQALNIWKYPVIDSEIGLKVQEEKYNSVSLADIVDDYFSIKPVQIIIGDNTYSVKSIREACELTLKLCIELDRGLFERTFVDSENYTRKVASVLNYFYVSTDESKVKVAKEVSGFYYDVNRGGKGLFGLIQDLLLTFDYDTNDVIIKYYK